MLVDDRGENVIAILPAFGEPGPAVRRLAGEPRQGEYAGSLIGEISGYSYSSFSLLNKFELFLGDLINLTGDLTALTGEMTVSATQVSFFSLKAPPPRVLVRFSLSFGVFGVSDDC